jgi:hypothetical protein
MSGVRSLARSAILLFNRIKFHLFFKKVPDARGHSNSKLVAVTKRPPQGSPGRTFLVFIRSGGTCRLVDDGGRNFDIVLNLYAGQRDGSLGDHEYLVSGGINKYKAAYQFIDEELLGAYRGFMFLDDDLEITYSQLSGFLDFCLQNDLQLAQPSQSPDSHCSHESLRHMPGARSRNAEIVEVMCPYFSAKALRTAISTFDSSYSTWGLDYLWPKLPGLRPVVVDAFQIRHVRPMESNGAFYEYMRSIGISPHAEERKLLRKKRRSGAAGAAKGPAIDVCSDNDLETGTSYER